MKFTFDYEETLTRRVVIDAENLAEAINEIERRINEEKIVLGAEDFAGGEIRMPLNENFLPQLQHYGENVKDIQGLDILINFW